MSRSDAALNCLQNAHRYLISRAKRLSPGIDPTDSCWGIECKRSPVILSVGEIPPLIGKPVEKLGEVMNIAATVERLD